MVDCVCTILFPIYLQDLGRPDEYHCANALCYPCEGFAVLSVVPVVTSLHGTLTRIGRFLVLGHFTTLPSTVREGSFADLLWLLRA